MKAVICTGYGPPEVLRIANLETPSPKPHQVRIKIRATSVTSSDCLVRGLKFSRPRQIVLRLVVGITRPRKPLGLVLAGDIDALGEGVSAFHEGDHVFGFTGFGFGGYAEYRCMREKALLTSKPANLSYEESAALPYGGLLAMYFLRKGRIRRGQKVLVYGASGAVGTSAVQLARHFGADVTAVCSGANADLVTSLGATSVIDYTREDFTKERDRYDLVLVAVGGRVHPPSEADCRAVLSSGGAYVAVDKGRPRLVANDLLLLRQLAEAGTFKPVIDRTYRLEQMVEAHRYVDGEHKKGNIAIAVS